MVASVTDSAGLESKIIDAIYRGVGDPGELAHAIELVAQYFDAAGALLSDFDKTSDAPLAIGVRTMGDSFFAHYAPYAQLDPAPRAFSSLRTGSVATTDSLFSPEFLRTNPFLNEFLKPLGIEASIGGPLSSANGRFGMISILQGNGRPRFESSDVARLERLTPHLMRALQLRRLFLKIQAHSDLLETVVDRSRTAMIGLSPGGVALFVNAAARAIAAAGDGVALDRQGRLVTADRSAARRLAALEAEVARGGSGGLVRIHRPSARPPYVALTSPLPAREPDPARRHINILIAIHDPCRSLAPPVQRIAHLMHLAMGAARVVQALLEGMELKEYAERSGISMNTVKFHLKAAFAKTETRSRTELMRQALLALNDLGAYFANE
jgi:GAF domain-containing protein/DNA-binding CsgD family transcriptional regulator